jgi:CDGSH-type Zn-finger protein
MSQVTIRVLKNGPYEVKGQPTIIDYEGATYVSADEAVYLCRCGQSANKPFCDGTHKKAGFKAEECVRMSAPR